MTPEQVVVEYVFEVTRFFDQVKVSRGRPRALYQRNRQRAARCAHVWSRVTRSATRAGQAKIVRDQARLMAR